MRKINITPNIEQVVEKEYMQKIHASAFHPNIIDELTSLKDTFHASREIKINTGSSMHPNWIVSPSSKVDYENYVDEILQDYRSGVLLTCKPSDFLTGITHKDTLVSHQEVNCAMKINGRDVPSLANSVVKALHYDNVRKTIIPPIYRKLELKTCVYCNANYTISTENGEGFYDLDHWKPKSDYPFLSISFFNLQPSCSSCNRRKSASNIEFFGLWDASGSTDLDVLRFKLDERSLVNYLVFLKRELLQVRLTESDVFNPIHRAIRKNTEERLYIEARYAEHNDYTEELVWKSKIYNPSMIQSLRDAGLSVLIPNPADLERFVLGTYSNPDDIHKRPLTRLAIDVAKQLRLL